MEPPEFKFSDSYPHQTDYEWCACDADGHVAVFTTAGIGPMPEAILNELPQMDALMEVVWSLPKKGRADMLVSLPRPDDFIHFASRGLFAYDWQDVHRVRKLESNRYEMLARPDTPIHLSELPERFHPLFRTVVLPEIRFADHRSIDIRNFFRCEPAI